MKKTILAIIFFFIMLFIAGGCTAVFQGVETLWQVIIGFLPIFRPAIEQSFKDYFTSAYFIVGVIIFIGSLFGITISAKNRHALYVLISAILTIISLLSIISNLAVCK